MEQHAGAAAAKRTCFIRRHDAQLRSVGAMAMSGWWDSIFGNLPPQSARPTSRGSTFGANYQALPTSANIEDRRSHINEYRSDTSSSPLSLNAQVLSNYPKGSHVYNVDQWRWLQKNMPDDLPTTPLPDPDFSLDPSIMARAKAQGPQERMAPWLQPAVIPPGPRSGPQFLPGMTLNSVPWGMGWGQ